MLHRLAWLAAVVALLVAACGSSSGSRPEAAPPATGAAGQHASVPAQLQFTAKTLDGREFSGTSLSGDPAVLWFWTPWCPTCRQEAPMVGRTAAANPQVTFVGVGAQDQLSAMRQFVDRYQLDGFTQLADTDAAVWAKFGVTRQPAFAFVGADGSVDVVKGALTEPELTERVEALTGP